VVGHCAATDVKLYTIIQGVGFVRRGLVVFTYRKPANEACCE